MELKGIDISAHQKQIDYSKLKGQIDFVMVRTSYGFFNEDAMYKTHLKGLEENNIPYGLYHYSYARNLKEAKIEVEGFINIIKNYHPTYPLVIDMEDADNWKANNGNPSDSTYVDICEYFCNTLIENGYYPMIYANKYWFENKLNDSRLDKFDKWLAQWSSAPTFQKPFGIWQYTSSGTIDGIEGNVDMNISYKDYPNIINNKEEEQNRADQILRVGSIVTIPRLLTVTSVDDKKNLIGIKELTGETIASYHWFDPTNFDVVDNNGNKTLNQVCYVGCKVKLNGEYEVLGLTKTEAWSCKLKIGNRTNWVWTEPCYEIKD